MNGDIFKFTFEEGINHILTWEALDHILFIAALCAAYTWREWKRVLLLVTAFTLGHSVTLILTSLGYINFPVDWVEFLIPITIVVTAATQLMRRDETTAPGFLLYFFALGFGFIHGMAYGAAGIGSLYERNDAVTAVLGFNLGVEAAQVCVVAVLLLFSFIFVTMLKLRQKTWKWGILLPTLVYALFLTYKNFPS
jgi:predicted neutral ceramidase superfamily lipid hydrolase